MQYAKIVDTVGNVGKMKDLRIKIFTKVWYNDFIFEDNIILFDGSDSYDYIEDFLVKKYKIKHNDKAMIMTEEMILQLIDLTIEKLKQEEEYCSKRMNFLEKLFNIKYDKKDYFIELKTY